MPRSSSSSRRTRSSRTGSSAAARGDYAAWCSSAIKEVGAPSFFALLVIAVSFLPVLTLEAQEGRLFRPLAYTKTLCMIVAAVLAITLDPALRLLFTRAAPVQFGRVAAPGGERASLSDGSGPRRRTRSAAGSIRALRPVAAVVAAHGRGSSSAPPA